MKQETNKPLINIFEPIFYQINSNHLKNVSTIKLLFLFSINKNHLHSLNQGSIGDLI
ncbi:unnamed protein product [marine sediment metagenome]|uniref:Uncharacterized protein n=1 Tax=marine sediment metagenome TaxID=412755 RepID=X0WW37_9ZZZZ